MGGAAFWVILVGLVLATLPLLGDRSLFAVPLSELMTWVKNGWVPDVKTQLGAFWLQDYLSKK